MATLDPFLADNWIRTVLLATAGTTTLIDGVQHDADAVALCGGRFHPLRDDLTPEGWPYIVWSGQNDYTRYANEISLAVGEYAIRCVMRQDMVPGGGDVEEFNAAGFIAIYAAFNNPPQREVAGGIVHGCEIIRPYIRLYGEPGRKLSEMGVVARITST